jgi:hypothetical protein
VAPPIVVHQPVHGRGPKVFIHVAGDREHVLVSVHDGLGTRPDIMNVRLFAHSVPVYRSSHL